MLKMPRSHLSRNRWRALIAALLTIVTLTSFALLHAGAQGISAQAVGIDARRAQQTRKKNIVSIKSTDTVDGTRVTIFADQPLNDYEAGSTGTRFYVIIPEAIETGLQALLNNLRGRGFDEIKMQKRGTDVVLSFRLQPGMKARIEQKFNRLDIVFAAPAPIRTGGETPATTISRNQTQISPETVTSQTKNNPPSNVSTSTPASSGTRTGRRSPRSYGGGGGRSASSSSSWAGRGSTGTGSSVASNMPPELPPETTGSTPGPTTSTVTTPSGGTASPTPAEQITQAQPQQPVGPPTTTGPTTTTVPTTSQPSASNSNIAAAFRNNWLLILIGVLVLITIGLVLASRSRARGDEEERRLDRKEVAPLKDAPKEKAKVSPTTAALTGAAAGAAAAKAAKAERAPAKDKAAAKEVAPKVNTELAEAGVKNLLAGESYDEAVIGTSDTAVRQHVAAELLAALAGRNPDRRERARNAFIKHGYLDEATRGLRTAEAPAERASAARSLGLVRDKSVTPHLVAALDDKNAEVRRASVEALAEVRDPAAITPLNSLLEREKDRKVPHQLIRRAIEACATMEAEEAKPTTKAAAPSVAETKGSATAKAETKETDDSDREVFEI